MSKRSVERETKVAAFHTSRKPKFFVEIQLFIHTHRAGARGEPAKKFSMRFFVFCYLLTCFILFRARQAFLAWREFRLFFSSAMPLLLQDAGWQYYSSGYVTPIYNQFQMNFCSRARFFFAFFISRCESRFRFFFSSSLLLFEHATASRFAIYECERQRRRGRRRWLKRKFTTTHKIQCAVYTCEWMCAGRSVGHANNRHRKRNSLHSQIHDTRSPPEPNDSNYNNRNQAEVRAFTIRTFSFCFFFFCFENKNEV